MVIVGAAAWIVSPNASLASKPLWLQNVQGQLKRGAPLLPSAVRRRSPGRLRTVSGAAGADIGRRQLRKVEDYLARVLFPTESVITETEFKWVHERDPESRSSKKLHWFRRETGRIQIKAGDDGETKFLQFAPNLEHPGRIRALIGDGLGSVTSSSAGPLLHVEGLRGTGPRQERTSVTLDSPRADQVLAIDQSVTLECGAMVAASRHQTTVSRISPRVQLNETAIEAWNRNGFRNTIHEATVHLRADPSCATPSAEVRLLHDNSPVPQQRAHFVRRAARRVRRWLPELEELLAGGRTFQQAMDEVERRAAQSGERLPPYKFSELRTERKSGLLVAAVHAALQERPPARSLARGTDGVVVPLPLRRAGVAPIDSQADSNESSLGIHVSEAVAF